MAVNSVGTKLYKKIAGSWVAYAGVLSLSFDGIEREAIMVASMALGLRRSYIPGYWDPGTLSLSLNYEGVLFQSLKEDSLTDSIFEYKVEFPDESFHTFYGFIISLPVTAQISQQIVIDVTLQITSELEETDNEEPVGSLPTVTTLNVENVVYGAGSCNVDFKIELVSKGLSLPFINNGISWGTDGNAIGYATDSPNVDIGVKTIHATSGLPPNTTVFYKAYAVNQLGIVYGITKSFVTPTS